LGDEQATSAHAARHLGAFSIAYAAGLLVVVARPARARTILPVAAVLAGALLITAVIDIAEGNVPLFGEAVHMPELLSVVLIWLLANVPRRSHPAQHIPTPTRRALTVVADDDDVADRDVS
jgi:CHASE2 domain-containing sensor protein